MTETSKSPIHNFIPVISAVICTRNRGSEVESAIKTIIANQHNDFELIVVDQSTNDDTEIAIKKFLIDSRFQYIRTATKGTGIARNIGLSLAKADIVAYTDDDCTVSENWLSTIEDVFNSNPGVGIVFCSVEPGSHDSKRGLIPSHCYSHDKLIHSFQEYYREIGMGAGMAVRKSAVLPWGGFDESFGPGSLMRSGEDHDLALRALLHNKWIYELSREKVVHHGFRTYLEFAVLTQRDWYAIGAVHAKVFKCFNPKILPFIFYNTLIRGFWHPITMVSKGKKPQGFKRLVFYWQGFYRGVKLPLDKQNIVYQQID